MSWICYLLVPIGLIFGLRYACSFTARGWGLNTPLSVKDSRALTGIIAALGIWVVCFLILRRDPGLLWNFPEWVELYLQDVFYAGFFYAASFLCAAVVCVARQAPDRFSNGVMLLSMILLCAYLIYVWNRNRPIADSLETVVVDGMNLQSSNSSCSAAATANALSFFGETVTEPEMAALMGTSRSGTIPARMMIAIRNLGFEAERFELNDVVADEIPIPAILSVDHPAVGKEGHSVCVMGITNGLVEVWDSAEGKRFFTREELAGIWSGRGIRVQKKEADEQ